jgi:hypothetical protein
MATLEDRCDELYNTFTNLPGSSPEKYHIWHAKHNENYSSRTIINKDGESRKKSWEKLLVNYIKFPETSLSKSNKFKSYCWNTIFGSGFKIIDKENNLQTTVYTPWYYLLLKPFFKGDLIRMKVKKLHIKQKYTPNETGDEERESQAA